MENESSIKDIISSSLEQVRTIIDADTVVGKQIVTPSGVVIIPISKVSMGFASGGLDLPAKSTAEGVQKNFGGGGGTGVTVTPIGFLTVTPEGEVSMLPMNPEKSSPIEQVADIINAAPDIIGRIKDVFVGGNSHSEDKTDEVADALEEAYRAKLAEEAELEPEEDELYEEEEIVPLTRADKKRLKQEEKARKKLEKMAKKQGLTVEELQALENAETETAVAEEAAPAPIVIKKKGKLSEKTLESGEVR